LEKVKRNILDGKMKKLETERELIIGSIKYEQIMNEKMLLFVKSEIEAINPHREKEQIAVELSLKASVYIYQGK
jgi:hypothetical protein